MLVGYKHTRLVWLVLVRSGISSTCEDLCWCLYLCYTCTGGDPGHNKYLQPVVLIDIHYSLEALGDKLLRLSLRDKCVGWHFSLKTLKNLLKSPTWGLSGGAFKPDIFL